MKPIPSLQTRHRRRSARRIPVDMHACLSKLAGSSNRSLNAEIVHRLAQTLGEDFAAGQRSEEHTSELQSHSDLVCRLLLEKKKKQMRSQRRLSVECCVRLC